jgi:hypothetical protein
MIPFTRRASLLVLVAVLAISTIAAIAGAQPEDRPVSGSHGLASASPGGRPRRLPGHPLRSLSDWECSAVHRARQTARPL